MRFLFVSCQFGMMNKIDCGASSRSTMLVKALTKIGQVDVISFYKEPIHSIFKNCNVIYSKYVPNEMSLKDKILKNLKLFFQPWNPHGYYRLSKDREYIVMNCYKQEEYDFVVCRYIYDAVSCGLMRYADRLIVDADDNLTNVFKTNYNITKFRYPWSRLLYLYKQNKIGKMSECFLKQIRLSYYSSMLEKPYKDSIFLHNVSIYDTNISVVTRQTPIRLILVGSLDYNPNRKGTLHFVDKIFPVIKEKKPNVELFIVGKSKDTSLLSQLNAVPGVKALGFVDDIITEYTNSRVVVVPIYHGTGTCVKFIEGIMMNRPVVSSPMGARGFSEYFKESEDYMLAHNDEEFADKVLELLNSTERSNSIAHHAHEIAMKNFSQDKFCEIVKSSIYGLLHDK